MKTLMLALALAASACTFSGQSGRQVPHGVVERGWTMDQVRVRLGDPQVTVTNPDGTETWTYNYSEYESGTYIPFIPFTGMAGTEIRVENVDVVFAQDGTVVGGTEAIFTR